MGGRLEGRIILVTGAAGTLGTAISAAIEREGGTAIRSAVIGQRSTFWCPRCQR